VHTIVPKKSRNCPAPLGSPFPRTDRRGKLHGPRQVRGPKGAGRVTREGPRAGKTSLSNTKWSAWISPAARRAHRHPVTRVSKDSPACSQGSQGLLLLTPPRCIYYPTWTACRHRRRGPLVGGNDRTGTTGHPRADGAGAEGAGTPHRPSSSQDLRLLFFLCTFGKRGSKGAAQ
jgi:hypothetical protein